MARIRVFIVLVLAVTAGGGLALGTYNYMQKAQGRTVTMPTRPVVVAAANLEIGADITKEDVKTIDWPANAVPAGAFGTIDEVTGRGLIASVIQNEPILPMKLASKEAGAGLPPAIPPGLRALSVRVNEVIGVAGYVLPGTRVDVVTTLSPTDKKQDTTSKVILTNVQVLAAGTKIERDSQSGKPVQVNVVTLLVNPYEAERLSYPWRSADPAADRLQGRLSALVQQTAAAQEATGLTFARIRAAVREATGEPNVPEPEAIPTGSTEGRPRLTEPWFC